MPPFGSSICGFFTPIVIANVVLFKLEIKIIVSNNGLGEELLVVSEA